MRAIRRHLTYANVMSTLAVFVVLGGGAYAATQLPKNSVGPKQLKSNAVTAAKIKKNAVTGAKVKNASLTGADLDLSTLGAVPNATNAATLGGALPSSYAQAPMWALVDKAGIIVRQSGGIEAAPAFAAGVYQVAFPKSLEGRGLSATRALVEGDLTGSTSVGASLCTAAIDCSKFGIPNEPRRALVAISQFEEGPPATFTNTPHAFWIVAY